MESKNMLMMKIVLGRKADGACAFSFFASFFALALPPSLWCGTLHWARRLELRRAARVRKVLGSAVRPGIRRKKKASPSDQHVRHRTSLARLPEHALGASGCFCDVVVRFALFFARFC
jgi:hypothetical protein